MIDQNPREFVKEICREKNLSLSALARELGVNRTYIIQALDGVNPSRPLIKRIAELLETPELIELYEEFLRERKKDHQKR